MLARRYEFYVLVAKTTSHSFALLTREILFLPLEHKIHIFSQPCNNLYVFHWCLYNKKIDVMDITCEVIFTDGAFCPKIHLFIV